MIRPSAAWLLPAVLGLLSRLLAAQGVTTAAIDGTVLRLDGSPVTGASVRAINASDGRRWDAVTSARGRFVLEDVAIGGPYRVEVRALGYAPSSQDGLVLALGQRLPVHFTLRPAAVVLSPVVVMGVADSGVAFDRSGPAFTIDRTQIVALPNHDRGLLALAAVSPHAVISPSSGSAQSGGISIGGQNRSLNAFQIDGGTSHDLYTGRLVGRETLPRPISLEALEEIQVLAAPFDVRHGNFAGGLVNAVTRSGGNTVRGTMFVLFQDDRLSGSGVTGALEDFRTWQFGGSIGGPVVPDRLHYFVSLETQQRMVPDPGPLLDPSDHAVDITRVTYAEAVRFQTILRDSFDLEPGSLGPSDGRQRAQDVFAKLGLQLGADGHVQLSHHHAQGDRASFAGRRASLYALSTTGAVTPATAQTTTLIWSSAPRTGMSNVLILTRLRLRDDCRPVAEHPAISVRAARGGDLWAGPVGACTPNSITQNALELTDNLTLALDRHVLTLGVQAAALRFADDLLQGELGNWTFRTLDDFAAARASTYTRTLAGAARGNGVDFRVRQIGVYAQDRWSPSVRFALTFGLRIDVHAFPDRVATDPSLRSELGLDAGRLPEARPVWSPRVAASYDLKGDGRAHLRAGAGVFSGRVPYSWLASAYRDNGAQELFLGCRGIATPAFDPIDQPAACEDGTEPVGRVSVFDAGLAMPRNLKVSFGVDQRLPGGVSGTLDIIYSRALEQLYLTDANLVGPIGIARGEGDRVLYGTIDPSGAATPARRSGAFGQVIRISNRDGDQSLSMSVQLRRRFGTRLDLSGFYSFTRSRDRASLVNFPARANLEHTPLDGTLEHRALRTSYFEVPHRVHVSAMLRLPSEVGLALTYSGSSGTPYTYVVTGDANADGIPTGQVTPDIVYVPRDSADIALVDPAGWRELEALIDAESCLREQRGRLLERNSCRNPWHGTVNARLTKTLPVGRGQSLELVADVYNVSNLVNRRWGLFRVTAPTPAWPLLQLRTYDTVAERGIYDLRLPTPREVRDLEGRWSRWLIELGARYSF